MPDTIPNTDVAVEYANNRAQQMTTEAQAQRLVAEYEAQHGTVSASPTEDIQLRRAYAAQGAQDAQANAPAPVGQENKRGFLADMGMQTVGGVRDALTETNRAIGSLSDWLDRNVLNLGYINYGPEGLSVTSKPLHDLPQLPEVDKSDRVIPSLTRGVAQFLTDFIPINRFTKMIGMASKVGAVASGAATMATAFDPYEKRVSNLVNDYAKDHPIFANAVTDYLAANPNDSEAEARFKNALEGTGIGLLTDGLFSALKVFKGVKGQIAANTSDLARAGQKAEGAGATAAAATDAAAPAVDTATAPAADAASATAQADANAGAASALPKTDKLAVARAKPFVQVPEDKLDGFIADVSKGNYDAASQGIDFNFDRIQTSDDLRSLINKTSDFFAETMDKAKQGTRPLEDTAQVAKLVGMDSTKLNALYSNTKNLDARMLGARQLLLASTKRLKDLAETAAGPTGTDADLLALRSHAALHVGLQAEVKGTQTEIARAMSAMRIISDHSVDPDALDTLMRATGGRDVNKKFAQAIADMTDPVQIGNYVRPGLYAKTRDAVIEYYINSLLSGVPTQVVNLLSNSIMVPLSIAERASTAAIGSARQALGIGSKDAAAFSEVSGQLFGVMQGFKDALGVTSQGATAFKQAVSLAGQGKLQEAAALLRQNAEEFGNTYRTAITEDPIADPLTKIETRHRAISAQAFETNGALGKALDLLGFVVGLPSRALVTADDLFKTIGSNMELYSQAYRQATDKGLTGEAFKQEVANIIANPSSDMRASALRAAREMTFNQELGPLGGKLTQMAAIKPELRLILPFIRTPANIIKYVGERTPALNLLAESQRQALAAGGRQADLVLAKTATGTLLLTSALGLAANGYITGGGPTDPDVYRFWKRDGKWQPYSFKVGDQYIAFDRMDPVGMFFGLAADMHDIANHYFGDDPSTKDLPSAIMLAVSKNLTSRTWLSGVTNAIQALNTRQGNTDPAALHYLRDMATAFVPNFLRGVRQMDDPETKEVWNLMDSLKAKTPGFSKDVPAARSLFGEKVLVPPRLGPDFVSPIANQESSSDPVVKEIMRLGIGFKKPDKKIGNVELTPQLYTRRDELAGKEATDGEGRTLRDRLAYEMGTERYQSATDGDAEYEGSRGYILRRIVAGYRQMAERKLIQENPELQQAVNDDKRRAASILLGRSVQ